jgi:hypothetical protein
MPENEDDPIVNEIFVGNESHKEIEESLEKLIHPILGLKLDGWGYSHKTGYLYLLFEHNAEGNVPEIVIKIK